jgi:hypothetical protein
MSARTTVRLPEALVAQAKRKALAEGRSLTALIEDGLRRVVSEPGQDRPKRRKPLPVSSATGGLAPGFSWDDLRDLETLEDIERLRRSS